MAARRERKLFLDKRRGIWRGRFHDHLTNYGDPTKRDLIPDNSLQYKIVNGKTRKRGKREIKQILDALYSEHLEALNSGIKSVGGRIMVRDVVQFWLDDISSSRDAKTVRHYADSLSYFLKAVGNFEMSAPPSGLSGRFLAFLKRRGISDASINTRVQGVRVFMNYCEREGHLTRRIWLEKLRVTKEKPGVFTEAQMQELLDLIQNNIDNATSGDAYISAINQRRAFYMLKFTGMRGGEVLSLPLERISENSILIADVPQAGFKVKGRQEGTVPIAPVLREFLDQDMRGRRPQEVWYLDNASGGLHWNSVAAFGKIFSLHLKKLGIPGIKPLHGFRSTVASRLLNAGTSPQAVKSLLRHASIVTTMGYFNPDQQELQKQIAENL